MARKTKTAEADPTVAADLLVQDGVKGKKAKTRGSKSGLTAGVAAILGPVEPLTTPTQVDPPLGRTLDQLPSEYVNPDDVFVEFDDRTVHAADQHKIDAELAVSIYEVGQLQPAVCARDAVDERLNIIAGRTRRRAVKLLREGFEFTHPETGEALKYHDPERLLWVVVTADAGEEETFVKALETNIKSSQLTDVQEAYAVKRLTEKYQWSLTKAAALFGYNNTNRQAKLLTLLTLEQEVIDRVNGKTLSLQTAIDVADLKTEVRLGVLARNTNDEGKVEGAKVREELRNIFSDGNANAGQALPGTGQGTLDVGTDKRYTQNKSPAEKAEEAGDDGKPKLIARNTAAFKKYIESEIESNADATENVKAFFKVIKKWLAGGCTDKVLGNAIDKYVA